MIDMAVLADEMAAIVADQVSRAVAPVLADNAALRERIAALEARPNPETVKGEPGAGIADLVIDRGGGLVATFTDGRMKELGCVIGKDGRDGMGPDDLSMELLEDGRTVRMAFTKGETEFAFNIPFPVVLDRGVFAEGKDYEEGDAVTWGGSLWIAQRSTSQKPDSADSGWRLAVKRGRDGKDAR